MRRTATAVFLSGWIGFLAVVAVVPAFAVLRAAEFDVLVPPMLAPAVDVLGRGILANGNGQLLAAILLSLAAVMIAAILALAFWLVFRMPVDERQFGEKLALGGLGATSLLVLIANLPALPLFDAAGSPVSVLFMLGLSALAIRVDRLLDVDDAGSDADDAGFRAALSLIGQEMARDASRRSAGRTSLDPRR